MLAQKFDEELALSPTEFLPEESEVKRFVSDYAFVTEDATGEAQLAASLLPVRAPNEAGDSELIDLSWEKIGAYYELDNPLVDIHAPAELGSGIDHPQTDLVVEPLGVRPGASPTAFDPETLVYDNTQADTDFLVRPEITGFETLALLRSPASPEQLSYRVTRPGAHLAETANGGAELIRGGDPMVTIMPPSATDAQGREVPVELSVSGQTIELSVSHVDDGWAYPILVDPEYLEQAYNWTPTNTTGQSDWYASENPSNGPYVPSTLGEWLVVTAPRGIYYWGGTYDGDPNAQSGSWVYPVPRLWPDRWGLGQTPTTYIDQVNLAPWYVINTDPQASPVILAGIWNAPQSGSGGYAGYYYWQGNWGALNGTSAWVIDPPLPLSTPGVGTQTGKEFNFQLFSFQRERLLWDDRAIYGKTFYVYLKDPEKAYTTDTGADPPTGWVNNVSTSVTATATDPGLGVHQMHFDLPGQARRTYSVASPAPGANGAACTGLSARYCPRTASRTETFSTGAFPEGVQTVTASADDPLGNPRGGANEPPAGASASWPMKIDHTPPAAASLSGRLVDSANPLVGALTRIDFRFTDPLSGAVSVELKVDGQRVDRITQSCTNGGCTLTGRLVADLRERKAGPHSYQIVVSDAAGNTTNPLPSPFTLDPTKPVVNATGPLPQSVDAPLATNSAAANIAATDSGVGDTGVAKIAVFVDDTSDFTDSPSCTPTCPTSRNVTYTYSKTRWPTVLGGRLVEITATDRAGNTSFTTLTVDTPVDPPHQICPAVTPAQQLQAFVYTAQQARDAALPAATAPSRPAYDEISDTKPRPSLVQPEAPPVPLLTANSLASGLVGSVAAGGITLENEICLMPTQTTTQETAAVIAHETGDPDDPTAIDAAIYPNSATDTDTIVRPTALGLTVIESLRGVLAPSSFSWRVGLEPGFQLQPLSNGGIAVLDPSRPPPPGLTVPPRPANAQDPNAIPDVATQLAEGYHQIARAQQETGKLVYTVITRPYMVDALGNSSPATLRIDGGNTITAVAGVGAEALVLPVVDGPNSKPPAVLPAHYLSNVPTDQFDYWGRFFGCQFADRIPQNEKRALILDFGGANRSGDDFGGSSNYGDGGYIPESAIQTALKRAMDAWQGVGGENCGTPSNARMRLTYGLSNQEIETRLNGPTNAEDERLARLAGYRQQRLLERIARADSSINLFTGLDMEPGWGPPLRSLELARGSATGPRKTINYGSAGGCASDNCGGKQGDAKGFHWSLEQLGHAAHGWPGESPNSNIWPFPQIYTERHVDDWMSVRAAWNANHPDHKLQFKGVISQKMTPDPPPPCPADDPPPCDEDSIPPIKDVQCKRELKYDMAWMALNRRVRAVGRELSQFPCSPKEA